MAMEKCVECDILMSDRAIMCRNCGYPIAANNSQLVRQEKGLAIIPDQRRSGRRMRDLAMLGTFASIWVLIGVSVAQL
jgi:RNA polymerase subunit RPABC4/transcription elongation factor Spt4